MSITRIEGVELGRGIAAGFLQKTGTSLQKVCERMRALIERVQT